MEDIENICQNQQTVLNKINEKVNTLNAENESSNLQSTGNSEILESETSKNLEQSEESISSKTKPVSIYNTFSLSLL